MGERTRDQRAERGAGRLLPRRRREVRVGEEAVVGERRRSTVTSSGARGRARVERAKTEAPRCSAVSRPRPSGLPLIASASTCQRESPRSKTCTCCPSDRRQAHVGVPRVVVSRTAANVDVRGSTLRIRRWRRRATGFAPLFCWVDRAPSAPTSTHQHNRDGKPSRMWTDSELTGTRSALAPLIPSLFLGENPLGDQSARISINRRYTAELAPTLFEASRVRGADAHVAERAPSCAEVHAEEEAGRRT